MNVESVMTPDPRTCTTADTANQAASLMWEHDCGSLPVVDASGRLKGMVTDRDLCMACYTQGKSMHEIRVESFMSKLPITLAPQDSLATAVAVFAERQVRRMPVVDGSGWLVGILSIADLLNAQAGGTLAKDVGSESILKAVHALSRPRNALSRTDTHRVAEEQRATEKHSVTEAQRAEARGASRDGLMPRMASSARAQL